MVLFLPLRAVQIPSFTLHTYGLMLALAFLCGIGLLIRRAPGEGVDPANMLDLGFWILICAIAGGKLGLVLVDYERYLENPVEYAL